MAVVLAIGLAVGLVVAAPIGYLVGNSRTGKAPPAPTSSAQQLSAGPLPLFEQTQQTLNKAKFEGDLQAFAEPWLPWLGGCVNNHDPGGTKLEAGERSRVLCRYGGTAVNFVLYNSNAERDDARSYRQRLSVDAHQMAPGLTEPTRKTGKSGVSGDYVEYTLRDGSQRVIAGLWWDREDAPVGLYIETLWQEGLGGKWEPLRNLWQRYS
jgi:hypothetical protein